MDYEKRHCEKHKHENKLESHLVTAVEFSAECPYGTAVALLDLESGTVKVIHYSKTFFYLSLVKHLTLHACLTKMFL